MLTQFLNIILQTKVWLSVIYWRMEIQKKFWTTPNFWLAFRWLLTEKRWFYQKLSLYREANMYHVCSKYSVTALETHGVVSSSKYCRGESNHCKWDPQYKKYYIQCTNLTKCLKNVCYNTVDILPGLDLDGGHIGNGYPCCVKLTV